MREIKFRIWCKQTEEMHTVEHMAFDNGELWYVEDEDRHAQPPYFMDRNDSVLMQYTGLKDKNGREIYDGDIIKHTDFGYGDLINVVTFDRGVFCMKDEEELPYVQYPLHEWYKDCEIIGNIYEHHELLEDK